MLLFFFSCKGIPETSEQLNSEEIDDDDDDECDNETEDEVNANNRIMNTVELRKNPVAGGTKTPLAGRTLDQDQEELRHYESAGSNEDEFFLVSSPSPFSLASVATARSGFQVDSFQLIEPTSGALLSSDEDNVPPTSTDDMLMSTSYNRLSNIIEEDDDVVSDNDQSAPQQAQLRSQPQETSQKELTETTPSGLDSESIEQYKEMLKLGEEVSSLYKNIQNELSRPVLESVSISGPPGVVVDYKPVMKKRVYHLNGAYLKNADTENDTGIVIFILITFIFQRQLLKNNNFFLQQQQNMLKCLNL